MVMEKAKVAPSLKLGEGLISIIYGRPPLPEWGHNQNVHGASSVASPTSCINIFLFPNSNKGQYVIYLPEMFYFFLWCSLSNCTQIIPLWWSCKLKWLSRIFQGFYFTAKSNKLSILHTLSNDNCFKKLKGQLKHTELAQSNSDQIQSKPMRHASLISCFSLSLFNFLVSCQLSSKWISAWCLHVTNNTYLPNNLNYFSEFCIESFNKCRMLKWSKINLFFSLRCWPPPKLQFRLCATRSAAQMSHTLSLLALTSLI